MQFKNIFFLFLSLLSITGNVLSQNNSHRDTLLAKRYAVEAKEKYFKGKFEEAITDFTKAIESDNKNYKYYTYRGISKFYLEQYKDAISDLSKAISLSDDDCRVYYYKAACEVNIGKYSEAIKDFNIAIKLYSDYTEAYAGRGKCYRILNTNLDLALKDLSFAIQRNNSEGKYFEERGIINYELRNFDNTIKDLVTYLKLGGKNDLKGVYYKLGMSYYSLKDYDSAIVNYMNSVKIEPNAVVYRYLGICYKLIGDTIQSRLNFNKSLEFDSEDVETYYYYATTEYYFNNCKKSLRLFEEYLKHLKTKNISSEFYRNRALAKACNNDTISALKDFEKAEHLEKNNFKIYRDRIHVLISSPNHDKLIKKDIAKAIIYSSDSNDIQFLYTLRGFIEIRDDDSLEAEQDLLKAKELNKKSASAYFNLGSYYLFSRNNTKSKAIDYLKTSILLDSTYIDTYKLIAIAYYEIKNDDEKSCEILKEADKRSNTDVTIKYMIDAYCNKKENELSNKNFSFSVFTFREIPLMKYIFNGMNW